MANKGLSMPEWRKDTVTGRWVIVSTDRGKRPSDFGNVSKTRDGGFCPLCEGNESHTPSEVLAFRSQGSRKDGPGWWVRVIPNKFPVLRQDIGLKRRGEGMYDKISGFGYHEVIVETPNHDKVFSNMTTGEIEEVLWAYHNRITNLEHDERVKYVHIVKNHGRQVGGILEHSHSQLAGLPIVPKRIKEEIYGAQYYYDYKERCAYCDMIDAEEKDIKRLISMNDEAVAFCPFASRVPFECWILPRKHFSSFEQVEKNDMKGLAGMIGEVLSRLYRVLDDPPFNMVLHTLPTNQSRTESYHFHFEIFPRLVHQTEWTLGADISVNPTPPEDAARYLREE